MFYVIFHCQSVESLLPILLSSFKFATFALSKTIIMANQVVISTNIRQSLTEAVGQIPHDKLFVLTDDTTSRLCFPVISDTLCMQGAIHITIPSTDAHKTLETLAKVWTELGNNGGTRHSLMVNLGGGMVTDLGGFAASTFKRGIKYINIPTTLLSMVDASVGGKTGINFNGLKNEIGVFNAPETVIIDTAFLKTLDRQNILSGYAEMLKHGLISDNQHFAELLSFDMDSIDYTRLGEMVGTSVAVKERIVSEDPLEHGIRKALNLGHTAGHAFESWALARTPCLHGYAVAWGLVCELFLSCTKTGFPVEAMRRTVRFVKSHYGDLPFTCDDYAELYGYMTHDKKNTADSINFTLLGEIGDIRINQTASKEEIFEMLDFCREGN